MKKKSVIPHIILTFLGISFAGSAFLLFGYSSSDKKNNITTTSVHAAPVALPPSQTASNNLQTPSAIPASTNAICLTLGPLNTDKKVLLDGIISENNLDVKNISVKKKPVIEIFWNLGVDEKEAKKLFGIQKAGAMQDEKFVLVFDQDIKSWVVSITLVSTTVEAAKELTKSIEQKAKQIQSGGTWEFREKAPGYFYDFNRYDTLDQATVIKIDKIVVPPKEKCKL